MKKQINMLLTAAVMGALVTSCLKEEDPYNAGFQFQYISGGVYANTVTDSIVFISYGPWKITEETPEATWCKIQTLSGRGNSRNRITVDFSQNTTGQSRKARFSITDTDHPGDARSSWSVVQTATRGDGSLGNAALVKGIKSSDGYEATINYDANARPVEYTLKDSEGLTKSHLQINYADASGVVSVNDGTEVMRGEMDLGSQTVQLIGDRDTIGYDVQYYSQYAVSPSMTYAFNFVSQRESGSQYYGILLNGQSLVADSLHCADSIRYIHRLRTGDVQCREYMQLKYGAMDNRCQSVDVNQLLLGFGECHPMLLLSMFRYVRSTSIITSASSTNVDITVTTQLNADKSVSRMVVKDARKGSEVTYDFTY